MARSYQSVYDAWKNDPVGFWEEAADQIQWDERWQEALGEPRPGFFHWFAGGRLNTCYNALDLHVETGRGEQTALIYDSPVTGSISRFTYRQLRDRVAKLAGLLTSLGVEKGDRVIVYMPMIPEAVMAMLACARLGAVHSVVFGGFAARELATRIDDAKPKLVLSASCGLEIGRIVEYKPLLDRAIELASHQPRACVILQRPQLKATLKTGRDFDWEESIVSSRAVGCTSVAATDPLYILYTSGTTGIPKGVVRDNGGHAVALKWSLENIFAVAPGDVFWAASDVGWVVGHSYIVYAPLLLGCTTVLYEGKPVGTPDPGAFWRVIDQHGVNVLFTAPTALRAIKREDPAGEFIPQHGMNEFRSLFLAGERCDPDTLTWAQTKLGVPVIDHWWQTESGWPIAANPLGIEPLPIKPGSAAVAVPGYDVQVLRDDGSQAEPSEIGNVVIKLPLPPGCLPTLWRADERFLESYMEAFEGFYSTSDAGFLDDEGYLSIMGRTDDIINVAGHRLSTGGMEEVVAAHPDVAECVVIGAKDQLKGEIPVGLVVLNASANRDDADIAAEVIQLVRDKIGPVAAFKNVAVVSRLPKTRSGKMLRGTIKCIADGEPFRTPPTIEDETALHVAKEALSRLGFG